MAAISLLTSETVVVVFLLLCDAIAAFSPSLRCRIMASSKTTLFGGYDATIGASPNTPIQLYISVEKTEEATRTLICLTELDIPFQLIEIPNPKPDWFLRIHPPGTTPALRNPADTDEIISNSSLEKDEVDDYLCNMYETLSQGPCPLVPSDSSDRIRLDDLRHEFHKITKKKCFSYLDNEDLDEEDTRKEEMGTALRAFFDDNSTKTPGRFLFGDSFTLLDVDVISSLGPIFSQLQKSKEYEIPKETLPKLVSWFELCNDRTSVKSHMIRQRSRADWQ